MPDLAFWKTFAKLLGFMLIAGIVGPAFLVLHFVVDGNPPWMLWMGAIITGVLVILAAVLARTITRSVEVKALLAAHGTPAIGRITSMRETGTQLNDRQVVRFELDVAGPRVPQFTTTMTTPVPLAAVGAITKGLIGLYVGDDEKVVVDWPATGLYSGQMPAKFSSEAHGRTIDLTGEADYLLRIVDVLRQHGIALDEMLDVRNRPEVRAQIEEIVDEFVDAQAAADSRQRTISRRLADLDDLLNYGQITRSEFESLRARVLDSI